MSRIVLPVLLLITYIVSSAVNYGQGVEISQGIALADVLIVFVIYKMARWFFKPKKKREYGAIKDY